MPSSFTKCLFFCFVTVFAAGCASSTGVRARSYALDKERVDQSMDGGNYGYLLGTPVPDDRSDYKKTRKVYVVEVTKDIKEDVGEIVIPERKPFDPGSLPATESSRKDEGSVPIVIPDLDEVAVPEPSGEVSYVDYEVQKNDTLQKISKKFYDTYRKWPQIFESNKDVLSDPDNLKPGMTIKVPVQE